MYFIYLSQISFYLFFSRIQIPFLLLFLKSIFSPNTLVNLFFSSIQKKNYLTIEFVCFVIIQYSNSVPDQSTHRTYYCLYVTVFWLAVEALYLWNKVEYKKVNPLRLQTFSFYPSLPLSFSPLLIPFPLFLLPRVLIFATILLLMLFMVLLFENQSLCEHHRVNRLCRLIV